MPILYDSHDDKPSHFVYLPIILRSQSHSMVRGEHPMAFMLPSVSLSEAGSETDSMSCYSSDVDLGPMSPMASMTGSNIYSQSLALLSPQPHNSSPRSLPVSSRFNSNYNKKYNVVRNAG